MGATNILDRVAASVGLLMQVDIRFETAIDVKNGGVLLAVPALLACGLLRHARKYFELPKGYYGLESLLLLLAFMALARLKSIESLRYVPPGEWGKLLGLDRIPEARTLRNKVKLLVKQNVTGWSAELCSEWMQNEPQGCGTFYIDGHVRVYYGSQTKLPRHYVSRQRLCLRATTDYWVNAMDGSPFFYVTKSIDPGLLKVMEDEIVVQLEKELPVVEEPSGKPGSLTAPRLTLVYDREGYSPGFMQRMRKRGIACITYHKHPGALWLEEEFRTQIVTLVSGEVVEMELAERGVRVGQEKVWMREIRRRTKSGHQTSVLSTHDGLEQGHLAASMFARWSQENFFRYMREHYGLDRIVDYCLEEIPDTTKVVNPAHRQLDGQVRKKVGELTKKQAQFGALELQGDIEQENVEAYEMAKTTLYDEVHELQRQVAALKDQRRATPGHITVGELPEEHRFKQLSTDSKHFVDTVKMVAYRAETAMVSMLREGPARSIDPRSLLRAIYQNEADLIPDDSTKTLTVRIHHIANESESAAIRLLCEQLNETETVFPGTEYQLIYEMGSSKNPRGQEV